MATMGMGPNRLATNGSILAFALALGWSGLAGAQETSPPRDADQSMPVTGPAAASQSDVARRDTNDDDPRNEITVTGSRIERAGFDQPTPTTVIGTTELRQGTRPNLQETLNDQPQFRATVSPTASVGNTSAGSAPVDLRGLGAARTLTLLNGRRFVGNNNLNYIPTNLVGRVEVVTGGASAAWGSDAVAGVVNIILKDKVDGFTIGGLTGISSRGDGPRYGADVSFGTSFADGKGQFLIGAEYVNDKGIFNRNSRSFLGSAGFVRANPLSATDVSQILVADLNTGNQAAAGLIRSGIFAGQVFNDDGTLRPFRGGTLVPSAANPTNPFPAQMIGGEDGVSIYDAVPVSAPVERISSFGRVSYDFGGVTAYFEGAYGRSESDGAFAPSFGLPATLTISATNPFLSQSVRTALANAGQTSFTFGKFFTGPFQLIYDAVREQKEGAVGINGDLGRFRFAAHYSHGQLDIHGRLYSPVVTRFNNSISAVSSNGQIVCGINADAITTNDDPACVPVNLFGQNNASAAAINYIYANQQSDTVNKLDSAGASIQGDLFNLWAGPLTVAVGGEARWEEQRQRSGALDLAGAFGAINIYGSPVSGGFNVKEGFGEVALPILNAEGKAKIDLNGAARYSDYSRSGGIWTWKLGATARLFDTLTFRGTRSRDIRAPSIGDLFTTRALNVGPVQDADSAGRPTGYNSNPQFVRIFSGGNPNLRPEIAKTTTFGVTFSPGFFKNFNVSVDYYDISISGAIAALSGSNLSLACKNGNAAACANITRDATGTITEVQTNSQNLALFQTRGLDIEAAYLLPMSDISASIPGSLRIRALATYVDRFIQDTGVTRVNTAGDVGSGIANAIPKWRGTLSFSYQGDAVGLDARVRYVDGGRFNHLADIGVVAPIVNNGIDARTYLDLGAQFKVADRFTLYGNVNNVTNRKAPLITVGSTFYDVIGTYYTVGARVTF